MERIRKLPAGLAALGLTLAVVGFVGFIAAGCGVDDRSAATFSNDTSTEVSLPDATQPSDDSTAESGPDDEAPSDGAPDDDVPSDGELDDDMSDSPDDSTTTTAPLKPLEGLAAELIADGFDQPILVTGAPGTSALFVVERKGVIRLVEDGVIAETPFLDLRDQLLSSSIEQGLLGLAFHPDYESTGRFFAYWTDPQGDSRLAEFRASQPTVADPDSLHIVLEVDQPAERHNAGMLQFGPDGLLYLALGDGGSGGSTAQDTSNLLGSILRLDVDSGDPYSVPDGNPFDDEIWAYGLRNPWRFSIDPVEELMYIGDVGQDSFEEINVVSLDEAGTNFGWFQMEGNRCFQSNCDRDGLTEPVLQYSHDEGCSITGGLVYRGSAIPEFYGHYFFGDWCKSLVRSMRLAGGQVVDQFDWTDELAELGQITSFGSDNSNELYAVNWDGELHKIVPVRSE